MFRNILVKYAALMLTLIAAGCSDTDENIPSSVSCSGTRWGIRVKWAAVDGAASYEVQYSQNSGMDGHTSRETAGTYLDLDDVDFQTVYYFRVRASSGSGWGRWSETVSYSAPYPPVVVETYNILGASVSKSPWPDRKEAWRQNVLDPTNFPDILGLQECSNQSQRNDAIEMLDEYYDYCICQKDISAAIIFWNKKRFRLVESGYVDMLADKYPNAYVTSRYALRARLEDLAAGGEMLVYNIHIPSGSGTEKEKYMALRKEMIDGLAPHAQSASAGAGNLPVIIMGDMNCYPATVVNGIPGSLKTFESYGYKDAYAMTNNRVNQDYSTYNSQADVDNCTATYAKDGSQRLDYIILWPEERFAVQRYDIVINFTDQTNHKVKCPLPSDHNPVRVALDIKQ